MIPTDDLNTTKIILFKSPREVQPIRLIGRKLSRTQFLKNTYRLATKQPFGHLVSDLDPRTSEVLRYCSNIVTSGLSIFCLYQAKAIITRSQCARKVCMLQRKLDLSSTKRSLLRTALNSYIMFPSEYSLKIATGNVRDTKKFPRIYDNALQFKQFKQTSLEGEKPIFARELELPKSVGLPSYL